jgi:predicted transcriptional regulator
MISPEAFLKDPEKYLSAGVVISTAEEYEELEVLQAVQEGEADLEAGRVYGMAEFEQIAKEKIAEWKNK